LGRSNRALALHFADQFLRAEKLGIFLFKLFPEPFIKAESSQSVL